MWKSIYIQSSGAKFASIGDRIDDGYQAIYSHEGGRYNINLSIFTGNEYAIWVDPFPGIHQSRVIASTFRSGATLLPPNVGGKSVLGVHAVGVDSITIGYTAPANPNRFIDLDGGIYAEKTNIRVVNNRFEDILYRFDPGGNLITGTGSAIHVNDSDVTTPTWANIGQIPAKGDNEFTNCGRGIYSTGTYSGFFTGNTFTDCQLGIAMVNPLLMSFEAYKNTFEDCNLGISAANAISTELLLEKNTITNTTAPFGTGISLTEGIPFFGFIRPWIVTDNEISVIFTGIRATDAKALEVSNNQLDMIPSVSPFFTTTGIRIQGCTDAKLLENDLEVDDATPSTPESNTYGIFCQLSPRTLVSCNKVEYYGSCITFDGLCLDSQILQNKMRGGIDGLVFSNGGLVGTQGGPGMPTQNKWFGTFARSHTNCISTFGPLIDLRLLHRNPNKSTVIFG